MNTLSPASHWILDKYIALTKDIELHLSSYEFAHAVDSIYKFLWDNYADWYVEYLKSDTSQIPFAKELFKEFVITASPFIPFEAEALWKEYFNEPSLLAHHVHSQEFLETYSPLLDETKVSEFDNIISFVSSIRSTRGLFAIDPAVALEIQSDTLKLQEYTKFITQTAKVAIHTGLKSDTYKVTLGDITYSIDITSFIDDTKKEIARTHKIIDSLEKQKSALENQLANEKFLENAAQEVVEEKKTQLSLRSQEITEQEAKLQLLVG
jgi:valyl-tRNA synthetase